MLTISSDEYTRECHVLWAERAMKAADVLHWLQKAVEQHGAPESIYGVTTAQEFIAKIVQRWLKENQIKTIYIEPGSPWQNGFVESFHGRFRDECFEPGTTVDLDRNAGSGGRLPAGVQSGEAAQRLGYESPAVFCGAELSIPSSGRASPSLRWGWTTNRQKHKLNHVPGLTHGLGQKKW